MRALLLAAGLGTRLRPLTDTLPKCLVPIHGKPLLQIWLERLDAVGIAPLLVNTHYFADQVGQFLAGSPLKSKVTQVYEADLLGTAGTLLRNLDFFQDEDGMLVHADNYCLADLSAFVAAHHARPAGCLLTMMTFHTDTPQSCGIVEVDERRVVAGFHEKVANPPGTLANGAVYILSAGLLRLIAQEMRDATDFSTQILPRLVGRIYTWQTRDTFIDIGTPSAYASANA